VHCSDVTSGGFAYYYDGSWHNDSAKNPLMSLRPGKPPKAAFGAVKDLRLFVAGDPDNPGYVWYGNLSHLDFSTGVSGGYISVIDDNRNSFEVGAGQDLYGQMFVYGTEDQPYLSRLEGDTPVDYTLPLMFQQAWSKHRTIQNVGNDLWTGSGTGVDTLSGVQQYGDVRSTSASERVKNLFESYWDSDKSFSGYYPEDGQYWLCLDHTEYSKVLIGHSKLAGFPWTEYDLPCTAKAFGQSSLGFTIGDDDGHLFYFNTDVYKDLNTTQIYPSFKTAYTEFPFRSVDLIEIQLMMASTNGATWDILVYKDGNLEDEVYSYPFLLPVSDTVIIDNLIMPIDDWVSAISPSYTAMFFDLNIHARSFQIEIKDVQSVGTPVYFNGCMLKYRQVERQ